MRADRLRGAHDLVGVASGLPNAMFSHTVPAKRKPSCGTTPSCRRSDDCVRRSVVAVDRQPAGARLVEAREELRDRRLACARVADERDGRAGRDVEVDPVQHLVAAPVPEADALEGDVTLDPRERLRAGPVETSGSSSRTPMILSSAAVAERNVL